MDDGQAFDPFGVIRILKYSGDKQYSKIADIQ